MSLREQYGWVASRAIDGTTTTMDFPTNGAPFVLIEVLSSSSLSVKAGLMGKPGTDRKVRSFLLSGASTETQVDPDTATGTVAAQDFLLVPSLGAKTVRITRAAGSGTMQGVACPSDAISAWILMKLLDGGGTTDAGTELTTGWTPHNAVFAASTNATVVKASAGRLGPVVVSNINDAPIVVNFYNLATTPDENSTPVFKIVVPANATAANGAGSNLGLSSPGIAFSTGIAYRIVKGIANNSTTAVDSAEGTISLGYK